jgi:hypothetical protein
MLMFNNNRLVKKGILALVLAVFLYLIFNLGKDEALVERFYSDGLYRIVRRILSPVFNTMPFSAGDLGYLILIACFFTLVIRVATAVIRRRLRYAGSLVITGLIITESLMIAFYLLWGLNYFRPPAASRLNLTDSVYSKSELIHVAGMLIDSTNSIRQVLSEGALQVGDEVILHRSIDAVRGLSRASEEFSAYEPKAKVSLISLPVSYLGTAGYFNPFTAEAQINSKMPVWLKPLTACHEMAHQMGFGREDEANFVGFLASKDSPDPLVKYSAYYMAVEEFLFDVMLRDSVAYKQLRGRISEVVLQDFKTDREFWLGYRGAAGEMSSIFYNSYLKFNNQPEGLRTYNRMITLTMAWFKKYGSFHKVSPG